jgi:hypothetical protein
MARSEAPTQLFQQCDLRKFPYTYARVREGDLSRPKSIAQTPLTGN